jgi:hypothetical protein
MNRRHFLSVLSAGIAGVVFEEAIPLGRVWSFPKKIVVPNKPFVMASKSPAIPLSPTIPLWPEFEIGDVITIADWPGQFVVSRVFPDGEKVELYSAKQNLVVRGVEAAKIVPVFPDGALMTMLSPEFKLVPQAPVRRPGENVSLMPIGSDDGFIANCDQRTHVDPRDPRLGFVGEFLHDGELL